VSIDPSYPKPISKSVKLDESAPLRKRKFFSNVDSKNPELETLKYANKKELDYESKMKAIHAAQTKKIPSKNQAWKAVFNYIAQESGLDIVFEPAKSQLDFELKLAKSYYDLAYLNPLQFNSFRDSPGYQAQIKRKSQPLRGMIFIKKNSPIKSFSKLRGSIIAFPGLLNFPASIIPRESLHRLNFEITPQFLANQNTVYHEVARGHFVAGAGTEESYLAQPTDIRNSLVKIWDSPGFSPYVFAAHPRVPFFSLVKLKRAMVRMNKQQAGKALLEDIFVENGFEVAKDSDWDEIKQIDLGILNGTAVDTRSK